MTKEREFRYNGLTMDEVIIYLADKEILVNTGL